ncbi:cyclase family protein [Orientia tsutsugamushi]|uniref:cyclase family protein n=1 Tax=Orientia tsutsugamushi TaxID=784 RepID=UPI003529A235
MQKDTKLRDIMTFSYKLIDLTHLLDSTIPTWNGGCGFNHDVHIDYSDCHGEYKFRVMKVKMHAGIGTHMDAPSHCIPGGRFIHDFDVNDLIMTCVVIDV